MVFENRILRKIFGPKREEDRLWRKLYNDDFRLYSSPNIVRVIKSRTLRWAGHVARMGEVFTEFWLEGLGKRPLERPRHRWEDNIKMDLRAIGINGVN
jgi:hypothetical protein